MKRKTLTALLLLAVVILNIFTINTQEENELLLRERSYSQSIHQWTEGLTPYPWAESPSRTYGIAVDGSHMDFAGHAGFKLMASGSTLTYRAYTHAKEIVPTNVQVRSLDTKSAKVHSLNTSIKCGTDYTFDTKSLPDGLYEIKCNFVYNKQTMPCTGYFFKNKTVQTCRVASGDPTYALADFDKLMKNVKPENNLSLNGLTWPSFEASSYHAKDDLCKLADSIVSVDTKKQWSDAEKVYAIVTYFYNNYAYDNWYVSTVSLRGNQKWSNPALFAPTTHVGTCADFANMLVIMCRYLGIPACGISNSSHMWAAVYIEGEWVTIDVSQMLKYNCNQENPSKEFWAKRSANFATYGDCQISKDAKVNDPEHLR